MTLDTDHYLPLHRAILTKDVANVVDELGEAAKTTLLQLDYLRQTPLILATKHGLTAIMRVLLKYLPTNQTINHNDLFGKTALMYAVENNDCVAMKQLFCGWLDVEYTDKLGYNALYYAFKNNFTEIATLLVKRGGASLQFRCPLTQMTLLMIASQHGNRDLVEVCLRHWCINEVDSAHRTALYHACKFPDVVLLLLGHGVDAEYADLGGKTALMRAAEIGCTEVVEKLVIYNVELDTKDAEGMTAVMYACSFGQLDALRTLIKAGASLRVCSEAGKTPVMLATVGGHADVMNYLLTSDADVTGFSLIPDNKGVTPLMRACQRSDATMTRILLEYDSSNIDARGEKGLTALGYALEKGHNLDCVKLLLEYNADPGVLTTSGDTALIVACGKEEGEVVDIESIRVLLDHMTPSQINFGVHTALFEAVYNEHWDAVSILLEYGADASIEPTGLEVTILMLAIWSRSDMVVELVMSVKDPTDRHRFVNMSSDELETPLITATERGCIKTVDFLLRNGARHTGDMSGWTPLYYAMDNVCYSRVHVHTGALEVLKLLLDSCTVDDVNHVNRHGRSVLSCAIGARNGTMIDLLVAHGASLDPIIANGSIWNDKDYPMPSVDIMRRMTDLLKIDVNARDAIGQTALYIVAGWESEGKDVMAHLLSRGANPWLTHDDGVLAIDRCQNEEVRRLLKNAMEEHVRFQTLNRARTLFHIRSQNGKRLKCITSLVLRERLLLGKELPLISAVLGGVICLNYDVFEELFDLMRVPWIVENS